MTINVKKAAGIALVVSTLFLGACHTMDGAGEDISGAGSAVQRAAQ